MSCIEILAGVKDIPKVTLVFVTASSFLLPVVTGLSHWWQPWEEALKLKKLVGSVI